MLGDKIIIKPVYYKTSEFIVGHLLSKLTKKYIITIGGESGSGKSVTAVCIQDSLADHNISSSIIHQDDYFRLPPSSNHVQRKINIKNVGIQEINIGLLQDHINYFLDGAGEILKPLVDYDQNTITQEVLNLNGCQILIVEGTYASILQGVDTKIFINRTYIQTRQNRRNRAREKDDEFIEEVLSIEHEIIKKHIALADIIIDNVYNVHII